MPGTEDDVKEYWKEVAIHGYPRQVKLAYEIFRRIPRSPRCKYCHSPFDGVGGFVMRKLFDRAPSMYNPQVCNYCEKTVQKHPGGGEVQMAFLFADVRGSTALSEKMGNVEFSRLIDRFYRTATDILASKDAFIEKIIGDEVTGLFFPGQVGDCYTDVAMSAARELLEATGHKDPNGPWAPVGIGVHSGKAYFGSVGSRDGMNTLTVLGEAPNLAARLAAKAKAGEILVSDAAAQLACKKLDGREQRQLDLKGLSDPVCVTVVQV